MKCMMRDTMIVEPTSKVDEVHAIPPQEVDQLRDYVHPVSIEQFRTQGYEMIDIICDYLR